MKKNKELTTISNIDNEYKRALRIAQFSVIGFFIICILALWFYKNLMDNVVKNKMVVVADRLGNEYLIDKKAQLIGHLENFHILFFRIDEFNYKASVNKSFNYIDNEIGRKLRDHYTANDWYKSIQQYNLSIGLDTDSIIFNQYDEKNNDHIMTFYGKQHIRSKDEITVRNLTTKARLKQVQNTIANPFGAMIVDFKILDNSDIEKRNIKGEVLKSLTE